MNETSVEEVFERYAERGYAMALVFDDDGRWAVSDMGGSPVPEDGGFTRTVSIGTVVKPEQWKATISEALALFVAKNPLPPPEEKP